MNRMFLTVAVFFLSSQVFANCDKICCPSVELKVVPRDIYVWGNASENYCVPKGWHIVKVEVLQYNMILYETGEICWHRRVLITIGRYWTP